MSRMIRPASVRQREYVAALIVEDITADEASRLIADLRRERVTARRLLAAIIEAEQEGDRRRLGALLIELKSRTGHGEWLGVMSVLGIHPRRAQRLIRAARRD